MTDYIGNRDNNKNTIGDFVFVPVVTGDPISSGISTAVASAVATIINSINKGKPNPNDWKGWNDLDNKNRQPTGTSVVHWIINDGDSIQNEALNILQYITNYGTNNVLGYSQFYNKTITVQDIANKLQRGGYVNEANMLLQQNTDQQPMDQAVQAVNKTGQAVKSIGTANWILYGGIALALFLILKKK